MYSVTFYQFLILYTIDPVDKWHLNLKNDTLDITGLKLMFPDINVRRRMYEYCYSNLGAIYAKGPCI